MYLSVGVGARTGAVLIVLYAVVVPILKLVLLAVAEVFRCGESPPFKAILVGALENGFFHILGIIIPTDLFFSQRGGSTTNQDSSRENRK